MSKPRNRELIRMFKGHFQSEEEPIPIALRHDSIDVVFVSLLEDDQRVPESPMPAPLDAMFDDLPTLDLGGTGMGLGDDPMEMGDPMMAAPLDMMDV